jgi:hypothetical protein
MAEDFEMDGSLPEESTNRTFIYAVAGLGALLLLSMVCMALYVLVLAPRQREVAEQRPTEIALENTRVAQELTETAQAARATATSEPTEEPIPTNSPTPTQVVVIPTNTPLPSATPVSTLSEEDQTATAVAQQTADALGGGDVPTPTPTPTALPSTGFADEIGLPGLVLLGAMLVVVIFFSRRLRAANTASS